MALHNKKPQDKVDILLTTFACILILYPCIILLLDKVWLKTGDYYGTSGYFIMRGGWPGYYISTYASIIGLVIGVVLLIIRFKRRRK